LAEKIRAGEVSSKNQFGKNSGFYKKNFAESKKEFCLLMPVIRLRILGATSQNCKWFFRRKNWRRGF
jgi:hypothetical protein